MRISDTFKSLPTLKARQLIPPHKRKAQWRNTIVGVVIAVGAFVLRWKLGMPWTAVYIMAFMGGFIASKDLMLTLVTVVPEAIAAIMAALSGKPPKEPDAPNISKPD